MDLNTTHFQKNMLPQCIYPILNKETIFFNTRAFSTPPLIKPVASPGNIVFAKNGRALAARLAKRPNFKIGLNLFCR